MSIALTAKAQQEFDKLTDKQKEIVKKLLPKKREILFRAFSDGFTASDMSNWLLEKLSDDSDAVPLEIRSFYQGLCASPAQPRPPEELAELRAHPENYPTGPFVFSAIIGEPDGTESFLVDRNDFKFFIKQIPVWHNRATHVTIAEPDDAYTVLIYRKDLEAYLKRKTVLKALVTKITIIESDGTLTTCKADELLPQ